jgi:hypothetical protein
VRDAIYRVGAGRGDTNWVRKKVSEFRVRNVVVEPKPLLIDASKDYPRATVISLSRW